MSFGKQVSAFVKKAASEADKEFGRNVLALYGDIVRGTPVDEGALQNNWQFGIDQTNSIKLPASKDKGATIARGAAQMSALRIKNTAVIFNNLEYAEVIENGLEGTRRVPARMMASAILMAKARNSK